MMKKMPREGCRFASVADEPTVEMPTEIPVATADVFCVKEAPAPPPAYLSPPPSLTAVTE